MPFLNISGYRFVALDDLPALQSTWQAHCAVLKIKGTILLSPEGININLSASEAAISALKALLDADTRFSDMRFHEFFSELPAFKRLKIKIKAEIITFRSEVAATQRRANPLAPAQLKQWLDEKREITLLDTRNAYEVELGTFTDAVNLNLNHFTDFKTAAKDLDPKKTVVMFCTGGIRCEKAALHLQDNGFNDVYQLDGGILGYFNAVGGTHYTGGCFVFDERFIVEPNT